MAHSMLFFAFLILSSAEPRVAGSNQAPQERGARSAMLDAWTRASKEESTFLTFEQHQSQG